MASQQKPNSCRSRPCVICRKWFTPNPKVRNRQKTCGATLCKQEHKRRSQAKWSERNPTYWAERRLQEQLNKKTPIIKGNCLHVPKLSPDQAQDVICRKVIVLIKLFIQHLQGGQQDAIRNYLIEIIEELVEVHLTDPQGSMAIARGSP